MYFKIQSGFDGCEIVEMYSELRGPLGSGRLAPRPHRLETTKALKAGAFWMRMRMSDGRHHILRSPQIEQKGTQGGFGGFDA